MEKVVLGKKVTIGDLVNVARYHAEVVFSDSYQDRVRKCRKLIDKFSEEERIIYGITTGLGDNWNIFIPKKDREIIQKNTLRSHAASVGEPLNEECVRAIMFTMIQHFGCGYTGIRLETLEKMKQLLNLNIIPYCPKHGSVGYLSIEANIGLVLIGEGKAYYKGELLEGRKALQTAEIEPIKISSKEGLTLISGTSSATALTSLAVYDGIILGKTNDIAGAMSLEVLKGTLMAMDQRLMDVRPHVNQKATASNIRRILEDSEIVEKYKGYRLQDALSLRCMPQSHGAAKKLIADALRTVEIELNSSLDNPLIFPISEDDGEAVMGCNADASYVGMAADTLAIAFTSMAKISERRIDRMLNSHVSELPPFLSPNPGLNSGLMVSQYAAAGIIGEMRLLAHPATIDNISTSAFQEDYVSMGYNGALKAYECVTLGRYVIATEILNALQAQDFYEDLKPSMASDAVYQLIRKKIPFIDQDRVISTDVEYIANLIKDEMVLRIVEEQIGELEF